MVELLELVHVFYSFEVSTTNVKVDDPIIAILAFLNAVVLECVNDAFVLRAGDFVVELCLLKAVDPVWFSLLYSAAFWIFEEDSGWAIFEDTAHEVHLAAFFVTGIFAVEIDALIQGFVIHPNTVESLFAVGLSQARFYVHALAFDQLDFRVHLEDLLFGHDLFFLLNDG
jgi:hypothetical protein